MGEVTTKAEIVAFLVAGEVGVDEAMQYADALLDYREATANIDEHAVLVQHPRALNPIENLYMAIRNWALRKLWAMAPRIPRPLRGQLWECG